MEEQENTIGAATAHVIDPESAENEFQRWAGLHRLDVDIDDMDAEDLTRFKKIKKRIVNGILLGEITIDEEGAMKVTLLNHPKIDSVTFYEREGSHIQGTDRYKPGQDGHKTYALMASMTKTASSTFAKMVGYDLKLCEGIFALLMD